MWGRIWVYSDVLSKYPYCATVIDEETVQFMAALQTEKIYFFAELGAVDV